MPSILKFLRERILPRDPSGPLFSAGVKAWKQYEETRQPRYLEEAARNHQAALDIRVSGQPRRSKSLFYTAMVLWAHCQGAVTKYSSSTVIAITMRPFSYLTSLESSDVEPLSIPTSAWSTLHSFA